MALKQGQREVSLDETLVRRLLKGPYRISSGERIVGVRMVGHNVPTMLVFLVEKVDETA